MKPIRAPSAHLEQQSHIEPELLGLFRCFVSAHVLCVLLWVLPLTQNIIDANLGYQYMHAIVPGILLLYLMNPWLAKRLARAYLPIALSIAAVGHIASYSAILWLRLAAGAGPKVMLTDAWIAIPALLIPCIFVAWQYGTRYVYGFALSTFLLDLSLNLPLAAFGGPPMGTIVAIAMVRLTCFLPVGHIVARLVQMLRAQRTELAQAHAKLQQHLATQEALTTSRERNRIARELHDILAHSLSALVIQLEAIGTLWQSNATRAKTLLTEELTLARDGMREARRAVAALRATPIEELGLAPAVRKLAQDTAQRADLKLDLAVDNGIHVDNPDTEQALYRILEEACANVIRHAQATRLMIRLQDTPLRLTIEDNGRGFDPDAVECGKHFGLDGMHERARLAGGQLTVDARTGRGTTLNVTLRP